LTFSAHPPAQAAHPVLYGARVQVLLQPGLEQPDTKKPLKNKTLSDNSGLFGTSLNDSNGAEGGT
jgi:hypothetical protein